MYLVLLSVLLGLAASKSVQPPAGQCLARSGDLYTLMSTKTAYDRVRGEVKQFKDCTPKAMWTFVRHGTRFPHDDQIDTYSNLTRLRDEIIENHQQSRGELCDADLDALSAWELVADPNQNMLLTSSGVEELRQFGERMSQAFPKLLRPYCPTKVDIRVTSMERTRQSADSFITGLYKRSMKIPSSMIDDGLLKNENNCSSWKKSERNHKLAKEIQIFRSSPEVRQLLRSVSTRLGFQEELSFEMIKDIYDICTFEFSWYHDKKNSPWCSAFSIEDLKIIEFSEDLSYFYRSSFGNPTTRKLGCSLVSDMIHKLTENGPQASLYFGHSLGIRKLLTSLGIGEDTMLSGDGYSNSEDRKWRTSLLTPFAANVMGVHYECEKGSHGIKETQRVAIFVNEKLKKLAQCGGREMCGLEEFQDVFAPLTSEEFCNRDFCQI